MTSPANTTTNHRQREMLAGLVVALAGAVPQVRVGLELDERRQRRRVLIGRERRVGLDVRRCRGLGGSAGVSTAIGSVSVDGSVVGSVAASVAGASGVGSAVVACAAAVSTCVCTASSATTSGSGAVVCVATATSVVPGVSTASRLLTTHPVPTRVGTRMAAVTPWARARPRLRPRPEPGLGGDPLGQGTAPAQPGGPGAGARDEGVVVEAAVGPAEHRAQLVVQQGRAWAPLVVLVPAHGWTSCPRWFGTRVRSVVSALWAALRTACSEQPSAWAISRSGRSS